MNMIQVLRTVRVRTWIEQWRMRILGLEGEGRRKKRTKWSKIKGESAWKWGAAGTKMASRWSYVTEHLRRPGAGLVNATERSLSGKRSVMKAVFKRRLNTVGMLTPAREAKLLPLDPLLSLLPRDPSPWCSIFVDTLAWLFHVSNSLFSVRNVYSPHPWTKSALHPHIHSSLEKVRLLVRFPSHMHQKNSNSIAPK